MQASIKKLKLNKTLHAKLFTKCRLLRPWTLYIQRPSKDEKCTSRRLSAALWRTPL